VLNAATFTTRQKVIPNGTSGQAFRSKNYLMTGAALSATGQKSSSGFSIPRFRNANQSTLINIPIPPDMEQWKCTICGYIYSPEDGDPEEGVMPGTAFESIPDSWLCPVCGVGKEDFRKTES
jgi:rubredoxin